MSKIIAIMVFVSGLLLAFPAEAGAPEDCGAVRQRVEKAFNTQNWDQLLALYTRDVQYFSSGTNELVSGTDALRAFYSKIPGTTNIKSGEYSAIQIAPTVVVCSGYGEINAANNYYAVVRTTLVLVDINGNWLISAAHSSVLPRPR